MVQLRELREPTEHSRRRRCHWQAVATRPAALVAADQRGGAELHARAEHHFRRGLVQHQGLLWFIAGQSSKLNANEAIAPESFPRVTSG